MFGSCISSVQRVAKKVFAAVTLLVAGAASTMFAIPQMAYADSAPETVTVCNRQGFPSSTGMWDGVNIAAHYATDENGSPLYCCAFHKSYPPEGETINKSGWGGLVLDYIVYYGYGGGGYGGNLYGYTGLDAAAITQIAVWYVMDGTSGEAYCNVRFSDVAMQFYNDACANASESSVYAHTAYIYDDGSHQPLIAQTIRCVQVRLNKTLVNISACDNATAIASANSDYSLNGAQYTLYSDAACTNVATDALTGEAITFTIGDASSASGWSNTANIMPGQTYYLRETKSPDCGLYEQSSDVTSVYVANGQVSSDDVFTVTVSDTFLPDPLSVQFGKSMGSDADNDAGHRE